MISELLTVALGINLALWLFNELFMKFSKLNYVTFITTLILLIGTLYVEIDVNKFIPLFLAGIFFGNLLGSIIIRVGEVI